MPRNERAPETPVRLAAAHGAPQELEEAYLRFAPLLRKIAIRKFGIPSTEAESLVHDVFATYFTSANDVHDVRGYLVGGICNASRHYLRRTSAANALFCGETPCMAAPTESILAEVERKLLLRRILARVGDRCRTILHRYYVNGETTDAIAGALDYKPSTVLIFLSQCRKRARAAYRSLMEPRS